MASGAKWCAEEIEACSSIRNFFKYDDEQYYDSDCYSPCGCCTIVEKIISCVKTCPISLFLPADIIYNLLSIICFPVPYLNIDTSQMSDNYPICGCCKCKYVCSNVCKIA